MVARIAEARETAPKAGHAAGRGAPHQRQHNIAAAELDNGLARVQGRADTHALVPLSTQQPRDESLLSSRGSRCNILRAGKPSGCTGPSWEIGCRWCTWRMPLSAMFSKVKGANAALSHQ